MSNTPFPTHTAEVKGPGIPEGIFHTGQSHYINNPSKDVVISEDGVLTIFSPQRPSLDRGGERSGRPDIPAKTIHYAAGMWTSVTITTTKAGRA